MSHPQAAAHVSHVNARVFSSDCEFCILDRGRTNYNEICLKISELLSKKQAAYGDSHGKSGKIMEILYPNGIPAEKVSDALTLARIIDKLFRIATDKDFGGEDPFRDIAGYAILSAYRREQEKNS